MNNPELQDRQRQLVVERERMRSQEFEPRLERFRDRGTDRGGLDIGWGR